MFDDIEEDLGRIGRSKMPIVLPKWCIIVSGVAEHQEKEEGTENYTYVIGPFDIPEAAEIYARGLGEGEFVYEITDLQSPEGWVS